MRFSGNTNVENADQQQSEINLSSASYPLTVRAQNVKGKVLRLKDAISGKLVNEVPQEGKPVLVVQRLDKIILVLNECPKEFALEQNYPNPFNPTTFISYQLPVASDVKLVVFDMLGREVSVLVKERRDAGYHEVQCDASGLASGVYLYRMTSGKFPDTKNLLLVRGAWV